MNSAQSNSPLGVGGNRHKKFTPGVPGIGKSAFIPMGAYRGSSQLKKHELQKNHSRKNSQ